MEGMVADASLALQKTMKTSVSHFKSDGTLQVCYGFKVGSQVDNLSLRYHQNQRAHEEASPEVAKTKSASPRRV